MKIIRPVFHGTYGAARAVARIVAALGWIVAAVGVIVALVGLAYVTGAGIFVIPSGILIAVLGLLQVVVGQGARAAVDVADYARQSLQLRIAQAEGLEEIDLQKGTERVAKSRIHPDSLWAHLQK